MKFSRDDLERIRTAAGEAEKNTAGEIASAVINESSDYAYYELLFAIIVSALWFTAVMFFHSGIEAWLDRMFWSGAGWHVTGFYGLSTLLIGGLSYLAANIPGFDRLIVPRAVIARRVRRRAQVHFMESGVYDTRDRTGILIFISLRERRVELIADSGINEKVDSGTWDSVVGELTGSIKNNVPAEGLIRAITECGKILAKHFPIKPDDTNELPDGLVFLED